MKVLFDTSSIAITSTGISRYVTELIAAFERLNLQLSIEEFGYEPLFSRRTPFRILDSIYRDAIWPSMRFSRMASKLDVDIIHSPAFVFPVKSNIPVLITLHDIYAFIRPSDFKFWHRTMSQYYIKKAVESSNHLLVQNEFTRQEVLNFFPNSKAENIHVVYAGIGHKRRMNYDPVLNEKILRKFSINSRPYLLSVSTIEPRKNFTSLIKAFSILKDRIDHTLLLVGQNGWKNSEVFDLVRKLDLRDRICFTGFIEENDLNNLYTHAACFVFPSFYEGFGFTPLEAMKSGCPVVSSNASCMPEVLGNAAIYFDPKDPEEMASVIYKVLTDTATQAKHRELGFKQSSKYDWGKTAVDTYNVYHKVINSEAKHS